MTRQLSLPARWTMWESFSTAIDGLAHDDEAAAKELLFAMFNYASFGREPDFGDNHLLKFGFDSVRFNLDASVQSCANGKRGGNKRAENAKKKKEEDELKRAKKAAKAMGNLYQATTVPEFGEDDLLPDCLYEDQAMFMDYEHDRKRRWDEEDWG